MQMNHCAEQLLTACRRSPAAGAGDFRHQASHVESFQQARDGVGFASVLSAVPALAPQRAADVRVPEASQLMIARHHRLEQTDVVPTRRVEARVASASVDFRFGQLRHLAIRGLGSSTTASASR